MAKLKGLEVDRRVGIALSVMPDSRKLSVERIIDSPRSFAEFAASPGRVRQMRTSGQPLYMMRVSSSLRLIYTTVGETIYVVDVVDRATLDHFAGQKNDKKKPDCKKRASKAMAHKTTDTVEK